MPEEPPNFTAGGTPEPDLHAIRVGRTAMACRFELVFNAGQYPDATVHAIELLDLVEEIESRLTIYRPTSDVSRLNRTAAASPQAVDEDLFLLLQRCQELHDRTAGGFDVAVGPLVRAWGFHQRQGRVPDPRSLETAMEQSGMGRVRLDAMAKTVRFDREGVELNFGAIGKGWALDRVMDRAFERLASPAGLDLLIHGGQSSVRASGNQATLTGRRGWRVGLAHPLKPGRRLATFVLENRALGTSGSGTQFFVDRGRRLGHILDPRTGVPAEGVISATVLAPTAAEADALSTALYVLGPAGLATIAPRGGTVGAVLVVPARRSGGVRVLSANLAPETMELADEPGIESVEAV